MITHSPKKQRDCLVMFHPKLFADEILHITDEAWRYNNIKI